MNYWNVFIHFLALYNGTSVHGCNGSVWWGKYQYNQTKYLHLSINISIYLSILLVISIPVSVYQEPFNEIHRIEMWEVYQWND